MPNDLARWVVFKSNLLLGMPKPEDFVALLEMPAHATRLYVEAEARVRWSGALVVKADVWPHPIPQTVGGLR